MALGIGIDTGGTYTDAVIYDFEKKQVLAKGKSLTTKGNLEIGIINAMDSLPDELLRKASILSLSTTLATNSCVENKGGRAKLILLGSSRKVLEWIDAKTRYGLKNEDVLCIDTDSIHEGTVGENPDWYRMIEEQSEWLSDAQALAVAEVSAMRNGAVFEKYTKEKLAEKYPVPFVISSELALGLNVMERGATALLNARLLPIIEEFLKAVRSALAKRNLDITEMIVRSDGSLMSEKIASTYPVQTILSGPASSVIGARNLASSEDCLIIDMGGTTTDISIVHKGVPATSDRISIGGYKTQIKGVYIDTFGLGGDSRITVKNNQIVLNPRRVQPLCVAAAEYPEIIPQLQKLVDSRRTHTMPLHEILYLVRQPKNLEAYTAHEKEILAKLQDHPIMLGSDELDIYNLKTERLETEGIVMRCGLTPTDIMHIKGDFKKFDETASVLGAKYLMLNLSDYKDRNLGEFCDEIYDRVSKKIYENILKILFSNKYPRLFANGMEQQVRELISQSWYEKENQEFFGLNFRTSVTLIGIGAPTYIFLPRVAEALGTNYIIPPHAEVANAVGAITADVSAQRELRISPNYTDEDREDYTLYAPEGQIQFKTLEEAVECARETVEILAVQDAKRRGAVGELSTEIKVDTNTAYAKNGFSVELDTFVRAFARGKIYN